MIASALDGSLADAEARGPDPLEDQPDQPAAVPTADGAADADATAGTAPNRRRPDTLLLYYKYDRTVPVRTCTAVPAAAVPAR